MGPTPAEPLKSFSPPPPSPEAPGPAPVPALAPKAVQPLRAEPVPKSAPAAASQEQGTGFESFFKGALDSPPKPPPQVATSNNLQQCSRLQAH